MLVHLVLRDDAEPDLGSGRRVGGRRAVLLPHQRPRWCAVSGSADDIARRNSLQPGRASNWARSLTNGSMCQFKMASNAARGSGPDRRRRSARWPPTGDPLVQRWVASRLVTSERTANRVVHRATTIGKAMMRRPWPSRQTRTARPPLCNRCKPAHSVRQHGDAFLEDARPVRIHAVPSCGPTIGYSRMPAILPAGGGVRAGSGDMASAGGRALARGRSRTLARRRVRSVEPAECVWVGWASADLPAKIAPAEPLVRRVGRRGGEPRRPDQASEPSCWPNPTSTRAR